MCIRRQEASGESRRAKVAIILDLVILPVLINNGMQIVGKITFPVHHLTWTFNNVVPNIYPPTHREMSVTTFPASTSRH